MSRADRIAEQIQRELSEIIRLELKDPRTGLITTGGVLVRTRVSEIREMGRATQGVTLISVDEGSTLSGVQKILEGEEEEQDVAGDEGARPDA